MAPDKDFLASLGLEIAKKKYYNAAKVESVVEELHSRAAALEEQNAALRARVEDMSYGKEEIGDAILSAKAIAQQLLAEAREEADALTAAAREKAEGLLAEAREEAEKQLSGVREEAVRLKAESEERLSVCESREQEAIRRVEDIYLQLRGQYESALRTLDGEWQRFLCSLGDERAKKTEPPLPEDLAEKLGEIAQSLEEIGEEEENEKEL